MHRNHDEEERLYGEEFVSDSSDNDSDLEPVEEGKDMTEDEDDSDFETTNSEEDISSER